MNAVFQVSKIPFNRRTIAAIIRKDMRALWPFALALAVFVLTVMALFRTQADYPEVVLDIGASQLHLGAVLMLVSAFGLPVGIATFIVLLVHQDPATDTRHDWMVRPISPLDLVAAKALVILAVLLIPSTAGDFIYAATHDNVPLDVTMGSIVGNLFVCIFVLVVAWLASSPVQALLAPLVLGIAALLLALSLGLAIRAGVLDMDAMRTTAPLEMPAVETGQAGQDSTQGVRSSAAGRPTPTIDLTWAVLIAEFLLMLGAAGVVLWLLLVRRRLFAARMTFLGFFVGAILIMLLQGAVSAPRDQMIAFQRVSTLRPSPPEAERFAAFTRNDANGDGKLDKAEYAGVLADLGFSEQLDSLWMQRDDNIDGFITPQEYRAAIPAAPGGPPAPDVQRFAAFTAHDANGDRRLDPGEYLRVVTELGFGDQFETLWRQRDGDGDGFVSAEEYGMPAQ